MSKTYGSAQIIAIPMIVMLVVFGGFGLFGQWQLGKILENWHQDKIASYGSALSELIEHEKPNSQQDLQDFVKEHSLLLKNRITIILYDGVVAADSKLTIDEIETMDNHNNRPEVEMARIENVGFSSRFSDTLQIEMLYVAVQFDSENYRGMVRVADSMRDVLLRVEEQRGRFVLFAILSVVIAGVLGLFGSQKLATRIQREKLRLEDRVMERTKDVRRLQTLGTLLSACNNTDETTEIIERLVPDLLPDISGALALFKASRNVVDVTARWGGHWDAELSYSPDDCWALRTGRPHPASEDQNTVVCRHFGTLTNLQTYCTPMSAHGEIMGALHLRKGKGDITQEEKQIVSVLAEQISLAVANIKLRQSLRDQAIRDSLTGLYNRRFLLEILNKEILRAKRQKTQIYLLMIDVDHFKKFNDNFGHDAGDLVLTRIGDAMQKVVRDHDIACRYGGEEFIIVLPSASLQGATKTAERLCETIRNLRIISGNNTLGPVSISVGLSYFPECADLPDELINRADEALYRAKSNGRDRVEIASLEGKGQ